MRVEGGGWRVRLGTGMRWFNGRSQKVGEVVACGWVGVEIEAMLQWWMA